jgi:uncharacterized protein (TIGR02246 family)
VDDQIESAYQAWNEAFNRGDAKAVASFYTDDAKLLPPTHDVIEGPQAIERFWRGAFKAGMTDHTLDLITAEGAHKGTVAAAKWSSKGKSRDGTDRRFSGIATHVFERQQDGTLKLWLHTWN